jgi:hypothetical protein
MLFKNKGLILFIISVFFAGLPKALADPLYQIYFYSEIVTSEQLQTQLRLWLATKAGLEVEWGHRTQEGHYFHFHLPERRVDELFQFLNRRGDFFIKKFAHPRANPPLRRRFILNLINRKVPQRLVPTLESLRLRTNLETDYDHDLVIDLTSKVPVDLDFIGLMGGKWSRNQPSSPRVQYKALIDREHLNTQLQKISYFGEMDLQVLKNFNKSKSQFKVLVKFARQDLVLESLWRVQQQNARMGHRRPQAEENFLKIESNELKKNIIKEFEYRFHLSHVPIKDSEFSVVQTNVIGAWNSWVGEIGTLDFISSSERVDFLSIEALMGKRFRFEDYRIDFLLGVNRLRVGVPQSDFYSAAWRFSSKLFEPINSWLEVVPFLKYPKFFEFKFSAYPMGVGQRLENSSSYSLQALAQIQFSSQWKMSAGFYHHFFKFDSLGGSGEVSTGIRRSAYYGEIGLIYVLE